MSGFHPNKIVVPVDLSPESLAAFDTALDIASSSSDVHVVQFIPKLNAVRQEAGNDIRIQDAEEMLRRQLPDENYIQIQIDLEVDDLGYRLVNFAKQIVAELIVMPSPRLTGVSHIRTDSLAERVIRLSHCPVLVLRN
jgi:nucleotide-binding universal stress UspA family protein